MADDTDEDDTDETDNTSGGHGTDHAANDDSLTNKQPSRRNDEHTVTGRHRRMRRADREVNDPQSIEQIIDACDIVRIGYLDAEGLTIVPVNFGCLYTPSTSSLGESLTLYMHSALYGRKVDAIKAAGNALSVAFEMEADSEVIVGRTPCNWSESFASIVGTGVASIVEDAEEANAAMGLLMRKQAHMDNVQFTPQQLATVTVWKIQSHHFTAKRHPKPSAR